MNEVSEPGPKGGLQGSFRIKEISQVSWTCSWIIQRIRVCYLIFCSAWVLKQHFGLTDVLRTQRASNSNACAELWNISGFTDIKTEHWILACACCWRNITTSFATIVSLPVIVVHKGVIIVGDRKFCRLLNCFCTGLKQLVLCESHFAQLELEALTGFLKDGKLLHLNR